PLVAWLVLGRSPRPGGSPEARRRQTASGSPHPTDFKQICRRRARSERPAPPHWGFMALMSRNTWPRPMLVVRRGPIIADARKLCYCTRRLSPGDRRVGFPITLLMCCRKAGNDNSRLDLLLESLVQHADNPANAEMLIKFDDDDPELGDSLRIV